MLQLQRELNQAEKKLQELESFLDFLLDNELDQYGGESIADTENSIDDCKAEIDYLQREIDREEMDMKFDQYLDDYADRKGNM